MNKTDEAKFNEITIDITSKFYDYCLIHYEIRELFNKWCVKVYDRTYDYNLYNLKIFLEEHVILKLDDGFDLLLINKYNLSGIAYYNKFGIKGENRFINYLISLIEC